jgi:capsid protein
MAYASGQLVLSAESDPVALTDALYIAPAMPWIDPMREAEALALMEDNVFMSAPEIIRRRGANPRDVLDQESSWQQKLREWGLARVGKAAAPVPTADAATTDATHTATAEEDA